MFYLDDVGIRIPIMDNNMIFIKKGARCTFFVIEPDDISVFCEKRGYPVSWLVSFKSRVCSMPEN